MARIVIGIDGGGTLTRALAVDLNGAVLASTHTGGSNPAHNPEARAELRRAITAVVQRAGCELQEVAYLVAGLAGLDSEKDRVAFDEFTQIDGLSCPRLLVNDAIVAHAAALRSAPGVIAIGGTGSIVVAVTEDGHVIRNYDFHHYAPCAARHLGYAAVFEILAGAASPEDQRFIDEALGHLNVADIVELRSLIATNFSGRPLDAPRRELAELAPLITAAAARGEPLALEVCAAAARSVATGVGLVAGSMRRDGSSELIRIALIGSVVRSPVMREMVLAGLGKQSGVAYREVTPTFKPAGGAVLMALQRTEVTIDDVLAERMLRHADARF
jgi:glucosamine kinase